jgi:esterase/lipase superfamily enzyme
MLEDLATRWQGVWEKPWVAPWITESWSDFLRYFVFDIPTLITDPALRTGVVAVATCAAFLMTWLAVSHTPRVARRVARILAAVVFLVPAALVAALQLEGDFKRLQAEAEHGPAAVQSDRVSAPVIAATSSAQDEHPDPKIFAAPPVVAAVVPPLPPPASATPAPVAPFPVVAAPTPPAATTPKTPLVRQAAVAPRDVKPARAPPPPDVMKLFYGTDRAVDPTVESLDYSAVRAQHLVIGQAIFASPPRDRATERPVSGAVPPRVDALTPLEIKPLAREDGLEAIVKQLALSKRYPDHVLVFVPGFHMSFEAALARAAQIGHDLGFDGALCVYSWPSAGRVARYAYDAQSARDALPYLKDFIRLTVGESGAKSVSFIGHGLGSQPLIEALVELKGTFPPGAPLADLILTAPDVDAATFGDKIANLKGHVGSITLYAAANDRALNLTRRYTGGIPRAGDVLEGGPLVLPGVVTVDVGTSGTDAVGLNATRYVAHTALIGDIAARLQPAVAAPSPRASLETIATPRGSYFRLPATLRVAAP